MDDGESCGKLRGMNQTETLPSGARESSSALRIGRQVLLELRAHWEGILPALVAAAGIYGVGAADGGFFPRIWRLSIFALAALTAAALIARERVVLHRRDWIAVGALAAYAAWIAMSKYWSTIPSTSLLESERSLLYAVCLTAVVVCVGRTSLPQLLGGALAGVTAACAYGLGDYVFSPPPLDPYQGKLLFEPLGYANAVGIYAAIGIVLAIGLALWASSRAGRVAALAPLVVLIPTLYLTSSRGAWVALPVGVATTLYVARRIRSPVVLLSLLAAGIAASFLLGSGRGQALSLVGANRPHYWRAAWNDYEEHPLLGSGAGTFYDYWLHHRPIQEFPHDAHSLYIESLAELGPLGLTLLVVALGLPLLTLRRKQEPLVAAAAGGYVTFLVHAGIDWDWEIPAVTLTGLLCGGAVLVGTRPQRVAGISKPMRVALLVGALALAVFAFVRLKSTGGLGLEP
jgi:O-antigen ligase